MRTLSLTAVLPKHPCVMLLQCICLASIGPCGPDSKMVATRGTLNRLAGDASSLVSSSHEIPPPDIRALVSRLNDDAALLNSWSARERRISHPGIERGIDGWSRELVMEVHDNIIYIRSKGRNGKDEHGEGDDLEIVIDCTRYMSAPADDDPKADNHIHIEFKQPSKQRSSRSG